VLVLVLCSLALGDIIRPCKIVQLPLLHFQVQGHAGHKQGIRSSRMAVQSCTAFEYLLSVHES
jgi:hypothetical protein